MYAAVASIFKDLDHEDWDEQRFIRQKNKEYAEVDTEFDVSVVMIKKEGIA